jgi:hypothetical protein
MQIDNFKHTQQTKNMSERDMRDDMHSVYTFLKSIPLTTPNSESNFSFLYFLDFCDPTIFSLGASTLSVDWLISVAIR